MKQQSGFTLIELVVVIVLLGILGAAATAKFQDLSGEARLAAIKGIAAEMQSGSAINYAKKQANSANTVESVLNCNEADNVLSSGALPAGYTLNALACTTGETPTCTVTDSNVTPNLTFDFNPICQAP